MNEGGKGENEGGSKGRSDRGWERSSALYDVALSKVGGWGWSGNIPSAICNLV